MASVTSDPFLISLAALLRWAPPLVFALYAGVLSDRLNRKRIVIAANVFRLAVLAGLIVTMVTGVVSAPIVLAALGLLATAEVFADNTTGTLAPMLVARVDLAVANARVQAGFLTLNQLAGPAVGAAIFAVGSVWPIGAQAVLVAAGALLMSRMVLPVNGFDRAGEARSLRRDIAEGFTWTVRHAAVRTLVLTILIFNITFGAAWSILVLYTQEQLGLGVFGFGLMTTVSAIGGLVGTASYGWITQRVSLGNVMRIGLIIETVTHLCLGLTTSAWFAGVVFFIFGAHAFIWGTTSITVRQRAVPAHLQGRVNSVNTICVYGGLVVGSVIGGVLATQFGVSAPFWFAFAGSAVFLVALWGQMARIAHADESAA